MKPLYEYLLNVKDHRRAQGQRTPMSAFVEMIILAGMSGNFSIRSIARFITNNEDYFVARYKLEHGTPAYATVRNFIKEVDYQEMCNSLSDWSVQYIENEDWIAVDGKAIGSTVTNCHNPTQNFINMVSMFISKKGIVINSVSIENKKEHEGNAARELIKQFEQKGVTFTMDALHCQKKQQKLSWSQEMSMFCK